MTIRIIGSDDWVIYARGQNGELLYAICEMWPEWLDAPNGGGAEWGTDEFREDWRYIMALAERNSHLIQWVTVDTELHIPDDEFRERTVERIGEW